MADQVMTYKYVVKNVARRNGKTVTFMPKPLYGDNGSGMHTHQSLWREGTPLMADVGLRGLSQLGRAYVGGLPPRAGAALCAPTTTVPAALPGYEAGQWCFAAESLRLYPDRCSVEGKRIEFAPRLGGERTSPFPRCSWRD
jgi:hypothetical protein